MARIICLICLSVIFTIKSFAQADSIHFKFEAVIKDYLKSNYFKNFKSIACYYGDTVNYSMEKLFDNQGSGIYFEDRYSIDTCNIFPDSKTCFFNKKLIYKDFLNFISRQNPDSCWNIPEGVGAFINAPIEMWEQLYYDRLIGEDFSFITPIVDIILSEKDKLFFIRIVLSLKYSNKYNFFSVDQEMVIKRTQYCKNR